MPPKSSNKKLSAASWYHCEACDVNITTKERETHEKVCPIPKHAIVGEAGTPLEYIRDGIFYTASVERRTFNIDTLQGLPTKYVNNLVFISEGAMRLAGFYIGQQVAIQSENCTLVRAIWPVPEKFLTTLFVTEEDFNIYWQPFRGTTLQVKQLPNEFALPAKTVQLQFKTEIPGAEALDEAQLRDVERIAKCELKQLVFTKGSAIYLNFFNKPLEFTVSNWEGFMANDDSGTTLTEAFEGLSLKHETNTFFQVTTATRIQVERTKSVPQAAEISEVTIKKSDIGGLDEQIQLIEEAMEFALGFKALPKGIKISRGFLLYGSTGCGKSMICEAISAVAQEKSTESLKAQTISINASEVFSKFLGETEKNLAAYFERAYAHYPQPSFVVIEDLHNLCPKQETNEIVKRVSVAFLSMLDSLSSRPEGQRIFILATTSQIDAINPSLRRCGRFDCEIEIGAPTPHGREQILKCLLRNVRHTLTPTEISNIAQITHGYVGADLANLIYSATLRSMKSSAVDEINQSLSATQVIAALTHVKPSAMREVLIECPQVRWTDIGGQAELKLKLQQAIEWPLLHPDKFKRLGIKPPRGLLMFGPPGCSKTMIAKALATESQLNFLSIKGPELFSMWLGESERAVREVFRKARQVSPAIVFFDEIDAIGGERAADSAGGASAKDRVLTQLLTELDGVESLEQVTVVAATNRPDMIDKALLRPGRIDRIIYVGLPEAEARREIFDIKLRAMPVADDVNVDTLVERTAGYTGAELQAVCHEAALKTLEQSFEATHIHWQHFEYALTVVQPRTSAALLNLYEEYLKKS